MPTVIVPALLRQLTNGQERVAVRGANVRQVVEDLERQFPGIKAHLVEDGDLKSGITVSVDGEMGIGGLTRSGQGNQRNLFSPRDRRRPPVAAIRKTPRRIWI